MKDSILYIDDELENLESFRIAFWMHYDIFVAENTYKAREIIQTKDIKVILTDQKMPEETGLEFVKKIIEEYPDIIYMVLTGYSDIDVVIEALNNGGIYRFIMKPWDMQEMRQTLDNAIESYNLRKKNKSLLSQLTDKNKQLRISERKFRNIFNSSLDSISIINQKAEILEVNAITCVKSGYTKGELLNTNFINIFPLNKQKELSNQLKKLVESKEIFFESSFSTKKGLQIAIDIIAKEIDYLNGKAFLVVARDITEKKELQQKVLKISILSEEKERTRIAQELHDGIGPLLSSVKLYVETYFNSKNIELQKSLQTQIIETIDDTIDHIAAISNNLSPHILKNFGLKTAVEKFCSKIQKSTDINIYNTINIDERFDEDIEITFYRVVIELINNTIKHSTAKNIKIKLSKSTDIIAMFYSDDGNGFNYEEIISQQKGMGLFNIKNRIESLKGEIYFDSSPKKNTQVKIKVPYEQN